MKKAHEKKVLNNRKNHNYFRRRHQTHSTTAIKDDIKRRRKQKVTWHGHFTIFMVNCNANNSKSRFKTEQNNGEMSGKAQMIQLIFAGCENDFFLMNSLVYVAS